MPVDVGVKWKEVCRAELSVPRSSAGLSIVWRSMLRYAAGLQNDQRIAQEGTVGNLMQMHALPARILA
jgi:hypothetical protein